MLISISEKTDLRSYSSCLWNFTDYARSCLFRKRITIIEFKKVARHCRVGGLSRISRDTGECLPVFHCRVAGLSIRTCLKKIIFFNLRFNV